MKKNKDKIINIDMEERKMNIALGVIIVSSIAFVFVLYLIIENSEDKIYYETISETNEQKYNQKSYHKENTKKEYSNPIQNSISYHTSFIGSIKNIKTYSNDIVILTFIDKNYNFHYVKTNTNELQNINYKINTDNNFNVDCQERTNDFIAECGIY